MRKQRKFEYPKDPAIRVGFDAEWVFHSPGKNRILSYQFVLLNGTTSRITALIIYPSKKRPRITLGYGLTRLFHKARNEKVIDHIPMTIDLVGHFTRADLSTLDDFEDLRRQAEAVRKTYVTTAIPIGANVASPQGMVRCNLHIIDTMLVSPAGTSLAKLGANLGIPKIELPAGYSKDHLDILLAERPMDFENYAITDAVIAVKYGDRVRRILAEMLGITRNVATLGAAAVELVRQQAKACDIDLNEFLGQAKPKRPLPNQVTMRAVAAQCYHGGYNVALALGFSPEGAQISDIDAVSAYTTCLATCRVPDWNSSRQSLAIDDLAVVDQAMTFTWVRFRFPDGTPYPCLPVRASNNRGLIHPLEGESWCTGPELVVALDIGAEIEVLDGFRVDWIRGSAHFFEGITRRINAIRREAKAQGDTILDNTVKEIGNSVYGKIAQGVANMRLIQDDCQPRRTLNTKRDRTSTLGPCAITNAPIAAYVTGMCRALLHEAVARMPVGKWIGTITTDGCLFAGSLDDVDTSGPIACAFRKTRARILDGIDVKPDVWEVKHVAPGVLVTKTRGTFTTESIDRPVLAKAGYRLPGVDDMSDADQCREWIAQYRNRTYDTYMSMKSLTPLRKQHIELVDLQAVERQVRWNADFDMKRRLVNVRDVDGLITADTLPWRTIDQFETRRNDLDDWKRSQRRVLRTRVDHDDMLAWSAARGSRKSTGTTSQSRLGPLSAAVLKVLAHRAFDSGTLLHNSLLGGRRRPNLNRRAARLMTDMTGVRVTEKMVDNAKQRGADPDQLVGSISTLTGADRDFLEQWLSAHPIMPQVIDIARKLCGEGSDAADDLDGLLAVAQAEAGTFDPPDDDGAPDDDDCPP